MDQFLRDTFQAVTQREANTMDVKDRYRGSLLGLAIGDALGTTLEFQPPGSFDLIADMIGGGPFRLQPGQWTDDTSMALCLAESLIACGCFDPADQMRRYVRWWREGYLSSTGTCFDIGGTVQAALAHFERTGEPWAGSTAPQTAGNGSLMRLAPGPLCYAGNPQEAIEKSGESSRTTHGAAEAVDACRYMAGLIVGAVQGRTKAALLADHFSPAPGMWQRAPLAPKIANIASGSFKRRQPPEIRGTGYVVDALEAALWAFHGSASFHDGALLAVNLGHDADTTGAVYGQLAGAFYGVEAIPASWRAQLTQRALIETLADGLFEASKVGAPMPRVQQVATPFGRSYWVEPGRLLAGFFPGDPVEQKAEHKLRALLDAGIRCVVNLMEEDEVSTNGQPFRPYARLLRALAAARHVEVTYVRLPIRDLDIPAVATMQTILDTIDSAVTREQATYVHCWGGVGRTGTVVGCYLARHGMVLGDEALDRIIHLRHNHDAASHRPSPETEPQRAMVRRWQQGQ